ncbi:MAG: insulinase family protein [Caldilineaceae bacterium]|nr:insulinase family protein [Caldilineaceae bacterium]
MGSFDLEEVKALSQSYLGNLPATDREESWQDVSPELPTGIVEADVFKGEGDQSIIQIYFTSPYEPSMQNDIKLQAMASVLDILVREELREELGGVYASGVSAWSNELPDANAFVSLFFGSDPARVDELIEAAFAQIADLQANGPSAENLEKAKAIAKSANQENLEQNGFWLEAIKSAEIYPSQSLEELFERDALIDALTAEEIQQMALDHVDMTQYVRAALFPESFQEASGE